MQHQDEIHELWLIYCTLKETECSELVEGARQRLGQVIDRLNRACCEAKSPGIQADNLNCRQRKKGLTPDIG